MEIGYENFRQDYARLCTIINRSPERKCEILC